MKRGLYAAHGVAVTAGRTVAETPGAAYNPLFIYSGSGLGKTHLLMAIGHAAKQAAPTLNVEYLTLDEYVEAFHAARSEEHTSELQSQSNLVCRLLLEKKK